MPTTPPRSPTTPATGLSSIPTTVPSRSFEIHPTTFFSLSHSFPGYFSPPASLASTANTTLSLAAQIQNATKLIGRGGGLVVVEKVSVGRWCEAREELESGGYKGRLDFDVEREAVTIGVPSEHHERLALEIVKAFETEWEAVGTGVGLAGLPLRVHKDQIGLFGAASVTFSNGDSKTSDAGLKTQISSPLHVPTLVSKCANSDSYPDLRRDTCKWLRNHHLGSTVNVVVACKITTSIAFPDRRPMILVEIYAQNGLTRPGFQRVAVPNPAHAHLCQQHDLLSRVQFQAGDLPPNELALPAELLFRPTEMPPLAVGNDLVISPANLQYLSNQVIFSWMGWKG